jgi:hypothetical protein
MQGREYGNRKQGGRTPHGGTPVENGMQGCNRRGEGGRCKGGSGKGSKEGWEGKQAKKGGLNSMEVKSSNRIIPLRAVPEANSVSWDTRAT